MAVKYFLLQRACLNFLQKETWRKILVDLKIPSKIQLGEYSVFIKYNSTGGAIEDILRIYDGGSVWQNPNGNRNVGYLYYNDGQRKLNLNWIDNDWNDNYRFAAVRQFLFI